MNQRLLAGALAGCLALGFSAPALAGTIVSLNSAVYVEKANVARGGGLSRSLQQAERLSRGDRVVTVLTWEKQGGSGGFTVVNPLPRAVAYQGSAREDEEVSADGGRTWGRLGEITIGSRLATAEDVTHVRWHVASRQAAIGQGRIAYSGIVR